jgi:hypothetical protein
MSHCMFIWYGDISQIYKYIFQICTTGNHVQKYIKMYNYLFMLIAKLALYVDIKSFEKNRLSCLLYITSLSKYCS